MRQKNTRIALLENTLEATKKEIRNLYSGFGVNSFGLEGILPGDQA